MLRLDNVAAYIWTCLETSPTLDQVCDQLVASYPRIPAQRIRSDAIAFIQQLIPLGFITTSNDSEPTQTGPYMQTIQPADLSHLRRHAAKVNVPIRVGIELTQNCNLACSHCYLESSRYEPMSTEQVKELLSDLATLGSLFLTFTGGEPFLRPDLLELIQYAESKRFIIRILTNGTLINRAIADQLKQFANLSIHMSIHGANPETHDAFTHRAGSFVAMVQAAQYLRTNGVPVTLKFSVTKANFAEVESVCALADDLGADLAVNALIYPRIDGNTATTRWRVNQRQLKQLMRKGLITVEAYRCVAGKIKCWIDAAGDVYPCELLRQLSFGNVKEQRFASIWYSTALVNFRNQPIPRPTECMNCRHSSHCQWCPALAYMEHGSYAVPPLEICRIARTWTQVQEENNTEQHSDKTQVGLTVSV